jgi:hypothetical protein
MDLRRSAFLAVLSGLLLMAAPAAAAPPANDNFAARQTITGTSASVPGTTFEATHEAGEPSDSQRHSVWYSWTPPQDMVVELDTCSAPKALITTIYSGSSYGSLVELDTRNDEPFPSGCPGSSNSDLHLYDVKGGTTYAISVYQLFVDGDAAFTLNLNATPRPANDDFASAQDLGQALEVDVDGTTTAASTESGEPGYQDSGNSVWYRWTAPKRTRVWVDNCGAETDSSRLTVYEGSSLAGLTEVEPHSGSADTPTPPCPGNGASSEFLATAGTTYMIQVATRLRDQGAFHLRLQAISFDATLHQTASAKKIKQGKTVTYTIDIENVGTLEMDTTVGMVTSKPNHLTKPVKHTKYVDLDATNGTTCKPQTMLSNPHAGARCKIDLKPGESTRITVKVRPSESLSHWVALGVVDDDLGNEDADPVNTVVKPKRGHKP